MFKWLKKKKLRTPKIHTGPKYFQDNNGLLCIKVGESEYVVHAGYHRGTIIKTFIRK